MTKAQINLIITLLFGYLGIHKFMNKNITMGLVYLFTGGLFGIGWIIDIVKSIIEVIDENKQPTENITVNPTVSSNTTTKSVKSESEKDYDLFLNFDDEHYLAYEYEDNIAIPEINNIVGNGGKQIKFKQETDNEYDANAVALYIDDVKIGYIYRGKIQDMVNDWIRRDDYFWGYINKINVEENKATFKVGFYKSLDNLKMKSFKLIKITKKPSEYGNSRFENLECCNDCSAVTYDASYDTENYIVSDELGNELGELGAKAVEWIDESNESIKFARINNISETDSGSYKADIEFFYE